MGLRDLLILVLGAVGIPAALYNPYLGILAYSWLSFMQPQSLVWASSVRSMRLTFAVGAALVVRSLFTTGPKVRVRGPVVPFVLFSLWMLLSAAMSHQQSSSMEFVLQFAKITVAVLLMTGLVRNRVQLKWLIIVLALCPGFYAFRLGLFLLMGGVRTHHGGPLGMDNNDTALFVAMSLPMVTFAASEVKRKWVKRGMYGLAMMAVPAVIAGGSRGGLLAVSAAAVLTVWRRATWWKAAVIGVLGFLATVTLIPDMTAHRYETIRGYEQDPSAMGRIAAWRTAERMADDRPLVGIGVGMKTWMLEYEHYRSDPLDTPRVAHSVWFSTLGGMGYVGLGLYVSIIVATLLTTRRVRLWSAGHSERQWAGDYAAMIECTIVTFMVGATFLSQIGFEYVFAIFMLSVPLAVVAMEGEEQVAAQVGAGAKLGGHGVGGSQQRQVVPGQARGAAGPCATRTGGSPR